MFNYIWETKNVFESKVASYYEFDVNPYTHKVYNTAKEIHFAPKSDYHSEYIDESTKEMFEKVLGKSYDTYIEFLRKKEKEYIQKKETNIPPELQTDSEISIVNEDEDIDDAVRDILNDNIKPTVEEKKDDIKNTKKTKTESKIVSDTLDDGDKQIIENSKIEVNEKEVQNIDAENYEKNKNTSTNIGGEDVVKNIKTGIDGVKNIADEKKRNIETEEPQR
jgi:hypothetical protein